MTLPLYPLINGHRFDFSSLLFSVGPQKLPFSLRAIDYKDQLTPGKLRGNKAQVVGRTRGEYEASGSCEIYMLEWEELKLALVALGTSAGGKGFKEVDFNINVAYNEIGATMIQDTLAGCRITENSVGHSEGGDPLFVKLELDIMYVLWNGVPSIGSKWFSK